MPFRPTSPTAEHQGIESGPEVGFHRRGQGNVSDGTAVQIRQALPGRALPLLVETKDAGMAPIRQEQRRAGSARHAARW